jgi:hypothetical protein
LRHAVAFREGCAFNLHLALRRGPLDRATWTRLVESHAMGDPHPPAGALKIWVRPPNMLVVGDSGHGYDDSSYRSDRQLWLSPLPKPGPFEVFIEWPELGIDATVAVDGAAIVRAAEQATPYWP